MFLRDLVSRIARRVAERLQPSHKLICGDCCRVNRNLIADSRGVLLKGAIVEITGMRDQKGRYQIRIVDLPDQQWSETSYLPYGPGFVLFVDSHCLDKV